MNEKEEPMNMNVTPPVEPVTEFEVPLPPDRKRPKWLVPLIAGGDSRYSVSFFCAFTALSYEVAHSSEAAVN